jgi:cell division protein FtsB
VSSAHRWHERREMRRVERRRRRDGEGRPPVWVQRSTAAVGDGWREVRYRVARATRGDRPLILALLGVLGVGVVVLSAPAQSYLDGSSRVQSLETTAAALDDANAELEQRVEDLNDPLNVELLAREQQGFARPGEVPYALVPPEVDRPRITAPRDEAADDPEIWYERAWDTLTGWMGD